MHSLLEIRKSHPALRSRKEWHIGWDDTYYAFLRELPEEKLLVIYNSAATERALEIPLGDTPLQNARQLQSVFGNVSAQLKSGKVFVSLPAQTAAIFNVQ